MLYISGLETDTNLINKSVRSYQEVKNSLHRTLDVAFNKNHGGKRTGNVTQNFSLITKIELNLFKNEKSAKVGMRRKKLRPGGTMIIC